MRQVKPEQAPSNSVQLSDDFCLMEGEVESSVNPLPEWNRQEISESDMKGCLSGSLSPVITQQYPLLNTFLSFFFFFPQTGWVKEEKIWQPRAEEQSNPMIKTQLRSRSSCFFHVAEWSGGIIDVHVGICSIIQYSEHLWQIHVNTM